MSAGANYGYKSKRRKNERKMRPTVAQVEERWQISFNVFLTSFLTSRILQQ